MAFQFDVWGAASDGTRFGAVVVDGAMKGYCVQWRDEEADACGEEFVWVAFVN